ncbi:MAG TPA: hypothetical protein DCR35_03080, partial [Runella sp.]|nr:hypothetical protein [Runella sp.]
MAFVLELFDWRRKSNELQAGIKALVWIGAGSAVLAAIFGLFLINFEDYGGDAVSLHQWTGLATMALSLAAVWALRSQKQQLFRGLLGVTVLGVTV